MSEHSSRPFTLDKDSSIMRQSTHDDRGAPRNDEERKEFIISRRGVFKWMPVMCSNDLVHGSWYYVWGSLLTCFIPLFPLINLFIGERFWPKSGFLPLNENTSAYALLSSMGVFYTIGSLAFLRAVETPAKPPLFTWRHFATDELFAMWMFAAGTLPSVPVMALYVIFNPHDGEFFFALILCMIGSAACIVAALCCYPKNHEQHLAPTKYISYMLCTHCCEGSCYERHLANDWLIVCWVVLVGCFLATLCTVALLMVESSAHYRRGIFDYATGLFDMILFLIGSMYIVAGSYPLQTSNNRLTDVEIGGSKGSGNEVIRRDD